MKKYLVISFIFFFALEVDAQEAKNIADLDFLYKSIQDLPSYKDQLKNDKSYVQLYQRLRTELNTVDDFEVYQKLLALIHPIRDNHLGLYRKPDSMYKFSYLKPVADLVELEKKYANSPKESMEGIYNSYDGKYKFVLYPKDSLFYLQSLNTGYIDAILTPTFDNRFDAVKFLPGKAPYVLYRNVGFSYGALNGLPYRKVNVKSYAGLVVEDSKFEYKQLENNIGYLRLSSFSSNDIDIKKATDFFNEVKSSIIVKNLIVDVRNNGGGGYKTSRQFINFLNNFPGKVYLLQNGSTVSNAEQFIINLKEKGHIKTFGETTKGTITYGSNYGKTVTLPSQRFLFYPTDMSGLKKELAFESIGIKPDIALDPFKEDWISFTIKYIKSNE